MNLPQRVMVHRCRQRRCTVHRSALYGRGVSEAKLSFVARLWLALSCFFRILSDGHFAAHVKALRQPTEDGQKPASLDSASDPALQDSVSESAASPLQGENDAALVLLGLLQADGRLVDFLQQDIAGFDDVEVGAAARVVHEGCGRVLSAHAQLEPVRPEAEESIVEVAEGYEPAELKLSGKLTGAPPYRGILRHAGWRVREFRLPRSLAAHDPSIVAPAEVEL